MKCTTCQIEFKPRSSRTKYCSRKCFFLAPWSDETRKRHSDALKGKRTSPPKVCGHCSKEFYSGYSLARFCSKQCANRFRVANGTHHLWKGGITDINFLVRAMIEYKKWKQLIIERDGFICKECHTSSFRGHFVLMHVDHIKPLSFFLRENKITTTQEARDCSGLWDIENGRVLCVDCHRSGATYAGRVVKSLNSLVLTN